ncbi:MAG: hypothetical protein NZM10_00615 [Fimbriimonadales bacterium]|nr:hypothetical protein [Fimbriimonadales bacterium]
MAARRDRVLVEAAETIAHYEGEPTRAGEPAGSSERGREFEVIVASGFSKALNRIANRNGFTIAAGSVQRNSVVKIHYKRKALLACFTGNSTGRMLTQGIQTEVPFFASIDTTRLAEWLRTDYPVQIWTDSRLPQLKEKGWVPEHDTRIAYSGDRYRELYSGLTTKFDATVIFLVDREGEGYVLVKKCLVECKSAKSSKGSRVDGNAHERFSFQNLEYLEIATLYPKCELLLLTNDAYVRYQNKYHSGFGVHALRLSNAFCWYHFNMVTTAEQYLQLFRSWEEWLKND